MPRRASRARDRSRRHATTAARALRAARRARAARRPIRTSDEEVVRAARSLDVLDLIEAFTRGWETPLGERGSGLSLGQRQVVCFTRAMLAEPRLVLLDEATSAVDPRTEERLTAALARLLAGRHFEREGLGKFSGAGRSSSATGRRSSTSRSTRGSSAGRRSHYRAVSIPKEYERVTRWKSELAKLDAVRGESNATSYYVERFARHAAPSSQAQA